jgi:soluble lytic murein transglycosylase-like protein
MKCFVLGFSMFAVCSAAIGDNAAPGSAPMIDIAALPAPPDWLSLTPPAAKAVSEPVDPGALIRAAAHKHRVSAAFITSIVAAESNFDPLALSPKGAIGLMQLMPATAQMFGADPAVPAQNVDAGTHYLRVLIDRYHKYRNWLTRVIAAYNAGPAVVDRYHGVPPYPETRTYVARVLALMKRFQRQSLG